MKKTIAATLRRLADWLAPSGPPPIIIERKHLEDLTLSIQVHHPGYAADPEKNKDVEAYLTQQIARALERAVIAGGLTDQIEYRIEDQTVHALLKFWVKKI